MSAFWTSPMDKVWAGIVSQAQTMTTTGTIWATPVATTAATGTYVNGTTNSNLVRQLYMQHMAEAQDCITPDEYERRRAMQLLASDKFEIKDGHGLTIKMPDGGALIVEKNGSYRIDDADSKVIYRANRVRDFNPFLNASDKLEDFIRFCGSVGVTQDEMLQIPIQHFIAWLVIEAAKADGEPEPAMPLLPDLTAKPRCRSCGRFTSRKLKQARLDFCRPRCFESALALA